MGKSAASLLFICLPLCAGNSYGKLPLSFEPNHGQTDAQVKFLARVPGYTLFVTADEAVFAGCDGSVQRMKLLGANRKMRIEPLDKQPGISNYFVGNDPSKWRTNIPNYGRVALREVYPGIDLVFYGAGRQLEYDWVVAPGADPKRIRVKWEGPQPISKNAAGDLILSGSLRQKKPVILQDGKRIEGSYVVRGKEIGFEVAKHDVARPLVIDPVFFYSTYLGGSGWDKGMGIAVDGSGNAYATGYTGSANFPTTNPLQPSYAGDTADIFVTRINAAGSARVYSTYLGGSNNEVGQGIAVDRSGNAYVTGWTTSTNFPTASPLQPTLRGAGNAFVIKISTSGSTLLYSTYLGGSANDTGYGIAVDGSGNVYLTGQTLSADFPTANPLQSNFVGTGFYDAFVTKINPSGSALVYSTYLGGIKPDVGYAIAVDGSGNAYVTGYTGSITDNAVAPPNNFPTVNALQPVSGGRQNAFVTKINAAGTALVYSTYLGGSGLFLGGGDAGSGIAVDGPGNAYVTGYTNSANFPTTNPLQAGNGGAPDAFVTKINATGSAALYSTYLGGSGGDSGQGIAVDGAGNAYVTGYTGSTNFPTANALQSSRGGFSDVFVTKISNTGGTLLYSTYLGGSGYDDGNGIAVDGSGNAYVAGDTGSTNFPTASPLQAGNVGGYDVFILSISGASGTAAFRDTSGAIELTSELSTSLSSSGGAFASDPSAAQNANGDTFVVARDGSNAVWVNVYDTRAHTWDGWSSAGGALQGVPAVAAIGSTAYIVARDAFNAYWTNTFTRGIGFGGWVNRGGAFVTDPAIGAGAGNVYMVGKDNFNAIWTEVFSTSTWQLQGAVVAGKPSVTVGSDGAAYIAIRDPSNAGWMGRQSGSTFNAWQPGGGTIATDPQVAGSGGKVYAAALTSNGAVWYNTFTEGTGNNWTGWQSPGGTLSSVAAAASTGPQLFLTGRDGSNQLWWYETPGAGWKFVGAAGLAAGPLSSAPR